MSFFPRDVLDKIWDMIGSVSEGFPSKIPTFIFRVHISVSKYFKAVTVLMVYDFRHDFSTVTATTFKYYKDRFMSVHL